MTPPDRPRTCFEPKVFSLITSKVPVKTILSCHFSSEVNSTNISSVPPINTSTVRKGKPLGENLNTHNLALKCLCNVTYIPSLPNLA